MTNQDPPPSAKLAQPRLKTPLQRAREHSLDILGRKIRRQGSFLFTLLDQAVVRSHPRWNPTGDRLPHRRGCRISEERPFEWE